MKRKSMIALGMTAVLTIGTCVPVLATPVTSEGDQTIPVEYNLEKAYSVEIPATITNNNSTIDFTTVKVILGDGEKLKISTTNTNINLALEGNPSKTLPMTLSGNEVIFDNNITSASKSIGITFDSSNVDTAGKYTKNVTFTVAIQPKSV